MHMIKRWCFVDMSYQQIFASRGDVEPLPNLEVTEMKAMCSTCLVHFCWCRSFLVWTDLIIWILVHWCSFVCFGQFNASCSCTLHRACLRRQDLRNLAPCGMWYVEGTISWSRARYAHLPQRAKGYCMLLQYIARRLELMWYVVVLCGPLISHC